DALFVGSAVQRFLERRADDHRPVHRFRGIEMATTERDRVTSATRLRRTRSGAFERPARALFTTVRRGQHSGLQSDDIRAVLSSLASSDETRLRKAARDHDAKEFAAR